MRAIDADAFDERVRAAGGMSEEELTEDFKDGVQAVLYMLSNQPTIQPEIIHCKDCRKHNKKLGFDENYNITYREQHHIQRRCMPIDSVERNVKGA